MANQDGEGPANRSTDARAHYIDPQKLMLDDTLSTAKKLALLKDWALEVDNLLQAAGEGMGASDPLKSQQEAALAEESARVQDALHALRSNTC